MKAAVSLALVHMALVPAGSYVPFVSAKKEPVAVRSFRMDRHPITRAEFLGFVKATPRWRKSAVKRLFADGHYLEDWKSDLSFSQNPKAPVTFVSWFAAAAYCRAQGKELPTTDQWEYAASDGGRGDTQAARERILSWYAQPNSPRLPMVGSTPTNGFGVADLHGLVWEWTLDFNSVMSGDESRDGGSGDQNLFCGLGSQGALDATDYASFMRYSFRSSLRASYAVANLGFRCVQPDTARKPAGLKTDGESLFQLESRWTDQDGKQVALDAFRGKPIVLAMVYTSCQGACPLLTSDLQRIEKALSPADRDNTLFLLVSFDSERDTPARLKSFATSHALDLRHWRLLAGSEGQVRELAAVLGMKYRKTAGGDFSHSNLITILDADGNIRHQKEGLRQNPQPAVEVLSRLRGPTGDSQLPRN